MYVFEASWDPSETLHCLAELFCFSSIILTVRQEEESGVLRFNEPLLAPPLLP